MYPINRNMGCIEMLENEIKKTIVCVINRNMGCIEIALLLIVVSADCR